MIHFRDKESGNVFAYEQSDLDTVERLTRLEEELEQARSVLESYDHAGDDYIAAQQRLDSLQEEINAILPVFYDIRENLKRLTLMTAEEVDEHINPKPTTEQLTAQARYKRDNLLSELDPIVSNPLRWNSFTPDQQQALADYRQALLDVPQQEGFPENIEWPIKPEVT